MGISKTVEVDVDIELDDFEDDELIEECEERGIWPSKEEEVDYTLSDNLFRHICDCGYHEPKDSLLNKLRDLM